MVDKTTSAGTWSVTAQQQTTKTSAAGGFQQGYNVFYMTGLGHQGVVFIPENIYPNTGEVKARVAAAATQTDAVGSLSSDG